jgi:glycosyltransferase involved in cell wall biosynthesis
VAKVLFVITDLGLNGAARQLTLLAGHLPRERFEVHVCVLGLETLWTTTLRKSGVAVETLGWRRSFDLGPVLGLRRVMRSFRPDVVHVWGGTALRVLRASGGARGARTLLSAALPPADGPSWLDRWLLRGVDRVLALGEAEADRYHRLGMPRGRVALARPAVLPAESAGEAPVAIPPNTRVLLGVGPIEPHKGFRDAVWTLDILHYLYDNLHLVLAGVGSDLSQVRHFAHLLGVSRLMTLPREVPDLGPLWQRSEVVLIPSRSGGINAALEAMAAGRPVVATRLPGLAEVVVEGVTGYLVAPGSKPELARQTRLLLDDPERGRQFGAAGRQRVTELYTIEQLVRDCAKLYEDEKTS